MAHGPGSSDLSDLRHPPDKKGIVTSFLSWRRTCITWWRGMGKGYGVAFCIPENLANTEFD